MAEPRSRPSSVLLEPPPKGVELEDPGASDHNPESDDEHFSDATEGQTSRSRQPSRSQSPVPRTRVEKVDASPRHGEVPGSPAYQQRLADAVPDEIDIVGEAKADTPHNPAHPERPLTPGGTPIPLTVVEKVDLDSPAYGEEPGTQAYEARKADFPPDRIFRLGDPRASPQLVVPESDQEDAMSDSDLPETLLSRVESLPKKGEERKFTAHRRKPSDAAPDAEEIVLDVPGQQIPDTNSPGTKVNPADDSAQLIDTSDDLDDFTEGGVDFDNNDNGFGDDFDDFKGGDGDDDHDDFGDFDDGFQQPEETSDVAMPKSNAGSIEPPNLPVLPPLLDFSPLQSLPDLLSATSDHLDTLFPSSANLSSLPPIDPFPDSSAIFTTERSMSLWSQLVAPPPLQPPNWTKSRIRRLFLVSLGVPVDLDEILPASKQKKLVLPSMNRDAARVSSEEPSGAGGTLLRSRSKRKNREGQCRSSTSFDSNRSSSRPVPSTPRRKGNTPPPDLDLLATRRLCETTDAALDGYTDEEITEHVQMLEKLTIRASEVLEYWLKKRDGQLGEKEAFEGVIENLVKHARQVRK
ncbi:hypothetical protein MGYG_02733 [Nannizzia gypsea CBS 118893]|uniref:Uncharacterized protein n=1 Tax=Arthroderma gypseum (strain ATCC MYA-4604 / CBS 118893) TaxID=535722 RepID=E4UNW7_ARTGP|nr:hypothetical protein MGYG_02733 [Nannizzia gypsea CBS 118893]EFQ99720.1 hypothetical protein MGYG_02733 [Nannizzia gypsea CBS 118893]